MNSILKFGASWCDPCKILDLRIEKLTEEEQKNIFSFDVDICERELLSLYNVRSVPYLIVKNPRNDILKRVSGLVTIETLEELLRL
jgi:thiol-disulfide isomerase/thioredoxin